MSCQGHRGASHLSASRTNWSLFDYQAGSGGARGSCRAWLTSLVPGHFRVTLHPNPKEQLFPDLRQATAR